MFYSQVTYQNRFIHTDSYVKNRAANRIVLTSFGTIAHRDPCKTLYEKYDFMELFHQRFMKWTTGFEK